jgi:hypothetical protein
MAYNINKYNTSSAATIVVEDGTINTTLDIKLIGKNYAGYGEIQNENFVWLLENFSSRTEPPNAIVGQLWFDSSVQKLKVNYATGKWHSLGVIDVIGANQSPEGLQVGDCWWNSISEQLYCKGSSGDVLIGGRSPAVVTQMRSSTVTDTNNDIHQIIEGVVEGVTVFIISHDTEFTLKPTVSDINGFIGNKIRPGITMRDTLDNTTTTSGFRYWGTATNSEKLAGLSASEYINQTTPTFPNVANFSASGLTIGLAPNQRLHIYNDISNTPTIHNEHTSDINFKTTITTNGVQAEKKPMILRGENILPGNPGHSNIGSDTADVGSTVPNKFNTIYAESFNGVATNALLADTANAIEALQADDVTIESATAAIGNQASTNEELSGTVAVRTNQQFDYGSGIDMITVPVGSLIASYFVGQTVYVAGGDLAERYIADARYEVGTVLMIGGDKEVTASKAGYRAIGTVSEKPGYLMNLSLQDDNCVPVALKGRVPVKVVGNVKKGDRLIASDNGVAVPLLEGVDSSFVFAIAISESSNTEVNIIEALIL